MPEVCGGERKGIGMSDLRLPWHVEPFSGCDPRRHVVVDDNGNVVAQCFGEDDGRTEALAICNAVNRAGDKVCAHCGGPATCFGAYEDGLSPGYACDTCCGHGCEDGHCDQLEGV